MAPIASAGIVPYTDSGHGKGLNWLASSSRAIAGPQESPQNSRKPAPQKDSGLPERIVRN